MTATLTMTLTEFLLARIAEDEAMARHSLDGELECLPSLTTKRGDVLYVGVNPARVLAECEAKREILALSEHGCGDDYQRVQHALAIPYADHPDYVHAVPS